MTSQCDSILLFLQSGRELTPLEALEMFRVFRLAARIEELREAGYDVRTRMVRQGRKGWAAYRLAIPQQREMFQEARV